MIVINTLALYDMHFINNGTTTTLSIVGLFVTLSITTTCDEMFNAECRYIFIHMPSVVAP
jgi:hypothetical protein